MYLDFYGSAYIDCFVIYCLSQFYLHSGQNWHMKANVNVGTIIYG